MSLGLTVNEIEIRTDPNQGMKRSARNALVFGLATWLFVGVTFVLFMGRVGWLAMGMVPGQIIGLMTGGDACLKHFVLRVLLIRNGSTPWNYVKFLDYAADRILLRKVGGGYMFIHRMLLEWFAARYVEPGTMPRKDHLSGEHETA
jgi:hypothetical protein